MKVRYEGPLHVKRTIQRHPVHDVVNDQGFAMHYRALSNMVSHLEVSNVRESIQQSKRMDWLLFYVECFRSEDFWIWFSRRTLRSAQITIIDPQCKEMKSQLPQLNQKFWSPYRIQFWAMRWLTEYYAWVKPACSLVKVKGQICPFSIPGGLLWMQRGIPSVAQSGGNNVL